MRMLWVGDVHVTPDELDDCQKLIDLVEKVVSEDDTIQSVLFAGDLHHTHSVVRLEVSDFWRKNLSKLVAPGVLDVRLLVGNHDQPSDTAKTFHALEQYKEFVTVIDKPTVKDGVLYVPHVKNESDFKAACESCDGYETIMCHQTFVGSTYENGFYAPDGFKSDGMKPIISGHIHSPQKFENVWYPGAPRWRSIADAKVNVRNIWILEFSTNGVLTNAMAVPTNGTCRSMYEILEKEGHELLKPTEIHNSIPVVHLIGTKLWTQQRSEYWLKYGAKVSASYTDIKESEIKESAGAFAGIVEYINKNDSRYGTSKERLLEIARERLGAI